MTQVCEDCGKIIEVSEWPWCPHGKGANTVVADGIPGGMVVENGFDKPTRFDSHSAHRKALDAKGYQLRHDNRGPLDKVFPRWDSVDLDAATALVSRTKRPAVIEEPMPITVREIEGPGVRSKDLA